ncbi:hypothetical protein COV20_01095 [Candidatus Woesearchaeota archaeon CG10_big_fil_rev_8_21_14_0_10_45_16]|nr:MAG: hypothetical protein COV20_01095 [Candidatus Woesearchaeota archaeon CG10_big_fil_rev_8_21_14_0_10_45_16]
MEYRKLISFGKNSFVISLPKAWISQNKLEKGDLIYLEEEGQSLRLRIKESEKPVEEKTASIVIDGKSPQAIQREVIATYVQNYPKIILKGNEIKSSVKELQGIIQNLIALEIMEQTSDSIIARDFLNMDTVSVDELLRKMDIVTRTMFKEMCNIFTEDNYENLNDRDTDVNRLYFLLYRAILYNLENPTKAMKNLKMTGKDLLKINFLAFYVEATADEVRRVARFSHKLKITPAKQKQLESYFKKMRDLYMDTMKAALAKDIKGALALADHKRSCDRDLKDIEDPKIPELNYVVSRLQRMTSLVHNMGRIVYTLG